MSFQQPQKPSHQTVGEKALGEVHNLVRLVTRIDEVLRNIDTALDLVQPKHRSGKLRIGWKKQQGNLTPMFFKFILKSNLEWWPKPLPAGLASRHVKLSKEFEPTAQFVKELCKTAESLLKTRRKVNEILGRFTASAKGATGPISKKIDGISHEIDVLLSGQITGEIEHVSSAPMTID